MKHHRIYRIGKLLLVFFLLTGFYIQEPTTAHTQGLMTSGEILQEVHLSGAEAEKLNTTATASCPTDPPMGQRALLLDDREIGMTFSLHKSNTAFYYSFDNPRDGTNLVNIDDMSCQDSECQSIQSPAIAMADLNGNDQAGAILAFRDSEKRIALGIPTQEGITTTWYSDQSNSQGKHVDWIDIAAGNLDGVDSGDSNEEVVIAFSDDSHAIHLIVPTEIDQPNQIASSYHDDTSDGRGKVEFVSVATGDLDGDGYDNEIITVFKDGNKNLQAMIFRIQAGSQTLKKIWARSWTDHYRHGIAYKDFLTSVGHNEHPIDITTGDIDGDFQDEVILAFRDNNGSYSCGNYQVYGHVQLLVLDYTGEPSQTWRSSDIDDRIWKDVDPTAECPALSDEWGNIWPQSISVDAADLDGDGGDEIALAFTFQNGNPGYWRSYGHLWTLEQVEVSDPEYQVCQDDNGNLIPCLQRRNHINLFGVEDAIINRIRLDSGDLDRDGKAEIAIAWPDYKGFLHISSYDADQSLTLRKNHWINTRGIKVEQFDLAMGDLDSDAIYGTYANNHYTSWNSYVEAVVHAPPYWPDDNDKDTDAAFGKSVSHGGGTGQTSEDSMGGSVTVKAEFHEVGPSFTAEWEKSCAVEKTDTKIEVEGTTFKTVPPGEEPENYYMDAVGYHMCPSCCYDYIEDAFDTTVTVCLPSKPCSEGISGLDSWYKDKPHADPPEGVGDSWVPVGMNLARGKSSQQSTTEYDGEASRAVDGNTDGDFANGSVTFANGGPQPWWQVDMHIIPAVHAVQLWNRTDAAPERLSDFYIFLSEAPFNSNDPDVLLQDTSIWHYHHPGTAGELTTITWNDFEDHSGEAPERSKELTGRYLRVQLTGNDPLSLAEVQVWGVPSQVDQWPKAEPSPTEDDGFTIELPDGTTQQVDGKFITKRSDTLFVDHSGSPEFNTSLEEEWEQMVETSTETTAKLGMSIKYAEFEYTTGSKDVRSRIMTWSKETEFAGQAGIIEENSHYQYGPYIWLQRANDQAGNEQSFLVVDYWVPYIQDSSQPVVDRMLETVDDQQPLAPEITSSTHPDPNSWYNSNTATFNWTQPTGDLATISGYNWYLDQNPETIPTTIKYESVTTDTYQNLADGIWYLHVSARSEGGVWSETSHQTIKIDTTPPQVQLTKDPARPNGYNGWYNTSMQVNITADDQDGSGVALIEYSTDNINWQTYDNPLPFVADTPGITIWAKATDEISNPSEPISTTFRIDETLPDSKIQGGPAPGAWFAEIVIDEMGNQHPILAGSVEDVLSGQAGMDLGINTLEWTSTNQELDEFWYEFSEAIADKVSWAFDGLFQLSRGNHYLQGRSQDAASNLEEAYNLGELVWFPEGQPDLGGSSLTVNPVIAQPGEVVEFTAAIRNNGHQEAWVQLSSNLPTGLTPVIDSMPDDLEFESSTRTLTWTKRLIWPGEWHRYRYKLQVDEGVGAILVDNEVTASAFWPNTDDLTVTDRQRFEDLEQTVTFSTTLQVDPALPAWVDNLIPWVHLNILGDQIRTVPQVDLFIQAVDDARWMYLREWTLDPDTGEWQVAQSSGWMPYRQEFTWTISSGAGVKYIGVWVADAAMQISRLDEHSLDFTNLLAGTSELADGQRHQYRLKLAPGDMTNFNLMARRGDPDLYGWDPFHALLPNYAAEGEQLIESIGFNPKQEGIHLFEVFARGDIEYQLTSSTLYLLNEQRSANIGSTSKDRPQHPLSISTPLTARAGITPDFSSYFPFIFKK